ncbi:hypothetical protein BEH_07345 [Priestia filamentosa]|jgi:hypothetical protein|uniref:Uncharacterized protein n=1 Tax=Priestia filamentosa TaxID=1402861 RepID=A0A0H4KGJ8_9BACI|nr:hypothetical protein [Priestia filamentosa]AKO91931.1 hypothetical protein BEH_07345 [Priestia filamentosa]
MGTALIGVMILKFGAVLGIGGGIIQGTNAFYSFKPKASKKKGSDNHDDSKTKHLLEKFE